MKWILILLILLSSFGFYYYFQVDTDGNVFSHADVWQLKHDNSVPVVTKYLKNNLHDWNSYESLSWSDLQELPNNRYAVIHTYRANNGFGAKRIVTTTFILSKSGLLLKTVNE